MIPLSSQLFTYRHHAGSSAMLVVGHLCLTDVVLRGSVAVLPVMGVRSGAQARACADSAEVPAILLFFKPGTADAFKDLISFIPIGIAKHPKAGALHQGIGCHGASRCLGIINLNSNEINDWLEGCPGMGDHTVIGMPDDRLGERICAFAVPLPGFEHLKLEDVTGWLCQNGVPKRFWPERLELIDRIPHTGSGKVKKYLLKEELEKRMKG